MGTKRQYLIWYFCNILSLYSVINPPLSTLRVVKVPLRLLKSCSRLIIKCVTLSTSLMGPTRYLYISTSTLLYESDWTRLNKPTYLRHLSLLSFTEQRSLIILNSQSTLSHRYVCKWINYAYKIKHDTLTITVKPDIIVPGCWHWLCWLQRPFSTSSGNKLWSMENCQSAPLPW